MVFILALLPGLAKADSDRVQFYAAPALIDSGLVQHIRPRFSLKTQVGVDMVADLDAADLVLGADGRALFSGLGETWHLDVRRDAAHVQKFADWLQSDIGARTLRSFAPQGEPIFTEPQVQEREVVELEISGDVALGARVSKIQCGRCHVIETGGMGGIGSTPSFAVMRSFDDWDVRFAGFYVMKPHAAFTQIEGVTDPFPIDRPSPIAPITLSLEDLEAMLAYVTSIAPADLGKPLAHQ